MKRLPKQKGMWEYLDAIGVLEHGTDAEIKAAKQAYRKKYFQQYKRNQRITKPEYVVNFSKSTGELETVVKAAKRHKMSMTNFLRSAVLAYLHQTFLVPNREQVAQLEVLLSDCLNEIQTIVRPKEKYHWQREEKWEKIELRITKLEQQIHHLFYNPPLQNDRQDKKL